MLMYAASHPLSQEACVVLGVISAEEKGEHPRRLVHIDHDVFRSQRGERHGCGGKCHPSVGLTDITAPGRIGDAADLADASSGANVAPISAQKRVSKCRGG
jgi:hypothetical protein